jgi:hypothetical protein
MRTFRGLAKEYYNTSFLERIGDSIWWTNHNLLLKDDPEIFKYFQESGFDKQILFGVLEEKSARGFFLEKGSRGYSGLKLIDRSKGPLISNLLELYKDEKKDFFLSDIPLKNFEFKTDYWERRSNIVLDEEHNDYIVRNLFPTKLYERNGFFKYFKDKEMVALVTGKRIVPIKN